MSARFCEMSRVLFLGVSWSTSLLICRQITAIKYQSHSTTYFQTTLV